MGMSDFKIVSRPWKPQDLIDDLQGIIDEESDNYLNTRRTTLCMARDYLKEHFAEQKWIPVTERLPTPYERVLVCRGDLRSENKFICVEYLTVCYGETIMWGGDYETWKSKVTHWMPLPEPPKGE